jgi:hypothetical protein
MNYKRLYDSIISKAKTARGSRDISAGYFEMHHILPKCLGGGDEQSNLVKLTAREHFIVHWLLCKIHKNYKLASAFNMMCRIGHGQCRNSRFYSIARKNFSEYHPCKDDHVKQKISKSLKMYYRELDILESFVKYNKLYTELKFCKYCKEYMSIMTSDWLKAHKTSVYCSFDCRQLHLKILGYNNNLSKIHKDRYSKIPETEMSRTRLLSAKNRDQKSVNEKIKKSKENEQNKILKYTSSEYYDIIDKFALYRSDGARNGNLIRWLKIRGIGIDEYYENRRFRELN